jgi:hypothetical protein
MRAADLPAPLVTRVRSFTVANGWQIAGARMPATLPMTKGAWY